VPRFVVARCRIPATYFASTVMAFVVLAALAPLTSGGASTPGSLFPALVTRAGTSDVLYVLWESPTCKLQRCLRLERSNNGGQTFSSVSAPPIRPVVGYKGSPLAQMIFANPSDGYALEYASTGTKWATTVLFVTHDGGRTWRRDPFGSNSEIFNMAASKGFFYATVDHCAATTAKCQGPQLIRTSVSRSRWSNEALPERVRRYWLGNVAMAASGSDVWLTVQDQISKPYSPFLATSHNEGKSFTVRVQPDLSSVNSCSLTAMSTTVLWAQCDQGMMQGDVPYSDDGGETWHENPNGLGRFAWGYFDPIASGTAYLVNGYHPRILYRTEGEHSPERVQGRVPTGSLLSLDFTNGRQGVALGQGTRGEINNHLWSTDDGGVRWKRIKL
jgi:photosystem II stability/assembly factor-like uncharacterized protein